MTHILFISCVVGGITAILIIFVKVWRDIEKGKYR